MGRSVHIPRGAAITTFVYIEQDEYDGEWVWDDFVECVRELLTAAFHTLEPCDRWTDREAHAIMTNGHADVVVCEYMGIVSVSLVPHDDNDHPELSAAWCDRVRRSFDKVLHAAFKDNVLRPMSTFSTGETFYRSAGVPA
jgi:hypothetical protein